ncbi:MAG TPA: class II aldolase/adducin family protein [Candidatus Krumholzibacterium sp.]|nr:class II aldolase/adducin family protein [Candidatus Krumholzibacterium sp.]
MEYLEQRKELASVMARLCRAGLTTSTGGNASLRVEGGCLITPSGLDKLSLSPSDIIEIPDLPDSGEGREGSKGNGGPAGDAGWSSGGDGGSPAPSMETGMHQAVYRARPDIGAVIHAHPLFATAYSATGEEIRFDLTGETRVLLERVSRTEFEMMGSPELADAVASAFLGAETVILGNHGAAAAGRDLHTAFSRIEALEIAARISFITHLLGRRKTLTSEQLRMIDLLFGGDGPSLSG